MRLHPQPDRQAAAELRYDRRVRAVVVWGVLVGGAAIAGCGPSLPNAAGCNVALVPGDLVITEVFADFKAAAGAPGTDTGKEWFEIYNARGQSIELDGVTITHSRPDGGKPDTHTIGHATIAPGQFFTLGNAAPSVLPAYVDYGYGADLGDFYNADGGKLALSCGDREIDSAIYDHIAEGHSRELTAAQPPEYTLNDAPTQWCQANDTEFETGNFGTPGADNDCQPIVSGQCRDRGTMRDAVAPGVGDLVITEVMASPAKVGDTTGEWFEVKAMADVDLNGVGLDRAGDNLQPDILASPACLRVTAGSYAVFARSAVAVDNGELPATALAGTVMFSLVPGTAAPGDLAILAGSTVVDAVTWTHATDGAALQLDPDLIDPVSNDTESNFCDATSRYGAGDLGTPGADNAQCTALPGPGQCEDSAGIRSIVAPRPGELVISELLVNPANVPGGSDARREWFEITNTGAAAFDLNELTVGRIATPGKPVQSARCISVRPGGFAVFARSTNADANSMLPAVDATFSFGLVDTNGDIQIATGASVLAAVHWKSVVSGVTRQLDRDHLTDAGNDDAGGRNFCAGTTPYGDGTNQGTPGAANAPCP